MTETASRWAGFCAKPVGTLAVWGLAVLMALAGMAIRGMEPVGPDDIMRMLEVRDMLAGQAWFDVTQYRVDPPTGASMHWSRLVDIPLALGFMLLGEKWAMALVPLLWLLAALFALRAIMQRMGLHPFAMLAGLATLTFYPLVVTQFMPMRIDHHGPQVVLGLWAVALLLRRSNVAAAIAGVLCAAWIAISLEALPLIAAVAGTFGLLYWREGDQRLKFMLAGLAIFAPAFSYATRPASEFALPFCDILAPGHMLAFAGAAVVAMVIPLLPAQANPNGRLAALFALPVVCVPLALWSLGTCATNPMAQLDPLVHQYWYSSINEGLPIWQQKLSTAVTQVWVLAVLGFGWWTARKHMPEIAGDVRIRAADVVALIGLLACLYSLLVMRATIFAQLLALPFAAVLLQHYMPRARALEGSLARIAATLACLALVTPAIVSAVAGKFSPSQSAGDAAAANIAATTGEMPECDVSRLAALEPGLVFTTLDMGPEVLLRSDHTILAASYHRNDRAMGEVIRAFIAAPGEAREIVMRNNADYLATCALKDDLVLYQSVAEGNLADSLLSGDVPDWLEPVEGFTEGALRVYRPR